MISNKKLQENCFFDVTKSTRIRNDELIAQVGEELRKLGYSEATIIEYSKTARRPYKNQINNMGNALYSTQISTQWLAQQYKRMEQKEISSSRFKVIKRSIEVCQEYYSLGKIEENTSYTGCKTKINSFFKTILDSFLSSLLARLAPRTISNHDSYARNFFHYLENDVGLNLNTLELKDLERYFIKEYPTHRQSISDLIHSINMLLSFLKEHNYINFSIDCRMFKPATRRVPVLPCFSHDEVSEILSIINTSTDIGRRDFAVILLASNTGLRGVDVFNLKLKDIDWNCNEIHIIQSKTGKSVSLPLHVDVGNALADYILHSRPKSSSAFVFLRVHAPHIGLKCNSSGNAILKRYLKEVSFEWHSSSGKTFHALRRSVGTWMAEEGVPLSTIAEVLGHRNQNSTKRYISFDKKNMTKCCLGISEIPVKKEGLL